MKFISILFPICVFAGMGSSFGQSIITGQVSQNDIYTNIEPDSTIQAAAVHLSTLQGTIDIDVDGNGVMDFRFYASGGGGLGGGSTACTITPLQAENMILSHPETSLGYPGTQYFTVAVADTLDAGFEISDASIFTTGGAYFWSSNYGASAGATVTTWTNTGEHYIGFRIKPVTDTLYGWIRVEVTTTGVNNFTLKDFACNINDHAGISAGQVTKICIYPNPSNDYIEVKLPEKMASSTLSVYNVLGNCLLKTQASGTYARIDIQSLAAGSYLLVVQSGGEKRVSRFVVQ